MPSVLPYARRYYDNPLHMQDLHALDISKYVASEYGGWCSVGSAGC